MLNPETAKILAEQSREITEAMTKFVERIDELTEVDEPSEYLSVDQLEAQLLDLESSTKRIYLDTVRRLLANAKKRKQIEAEKENPWKQG